MKIETTMRYHLIHLSEWSSLKNLSIEKRDHPPPYCWWKCKLVQPLWKTVRRFLKKINIKLPCNPVIPLLCTHPAKITLQKDTLTPMFRAALVTIAKKWNQPKRPWADERIKMHIYTMEYHSAIKKGDNAMCSDMDAIRSSSQAKSVRSKRKTAHSTAFTWNLRYDTNEPIYETGSRM